MSQLDNDRQDAGAMATGNAADMSIISSRRSRASSERYEPVILSDSEGSARPTRDPSPGQAQGTAPTGMTGERRMTVACRGSSTTAARGTFDWIGELKKRPQNKQFRFINLGVGGDLAYSALQRLSGVVACHPDKVVILIGANDILTQVFKNARRVLGSWKRLPNDP